MKVNTAKINAIRNVLVFGRFCDRFLAKVCLDVLNQITISVGIELFRKMLHSKSD